MNIRKIFLKRYAGILLPYTIFCQSQDTSIKEKIFSIHFQNSVYCLALHRNEFITFDSKELRMWDRYLPLADSQDEAQNKKETQKHHYESIEKWYQNHFKSFVAILNLIMGLNN